VGEYPVVLATQTAAIEETDVEGSLRFADVYARWFDEVVRWMRALGAPEAD
jgi:hypothetical protein